MYAVKEIYYTLQGEGYHTGRPAVFCRFAGCNLWSGLEKDRATAICTFCDTDFHGTDGENGGKYTAEQLSNKLLELWPDLKEPVYVVFTGGEPGLQMDDELINVLKSNGIILAIETNGTIKLPEGIDWVCVSPKADTEILQTSGNELKLVHPQIDVDPKSFEHLSFEHFYLQPLHDEFIDKNSKLCLNYCRSNPKWKLSIQTHKILGIP